VNSLPTLMTKSGSKIRDSHLLRGKTRVHIQPQFNDNVLIDVNPQVGFRVSWRVTTGVGWNERFGFDSSKKKFTENDRVFGPRAFAQIKLKESYYAMATAE